MSLVDLSGPDSEIRFDEGFLAPREADHIFQELLAQIPWRQESMNIAGRQIPFPRLTSWHGDPGTDYTYSGRKFQPEPWISPLATVKMLVETLIGYSFNSVLLNQYRTGADSVGFHSDDEPELGPCPLIASVSLGGDRTFVLRHKARQYDDIKINLSHGSCLIMSGDTQRCWQHSVPKTKIPVPPRINLTFRRITTN